MTDLTANAAAPRTRAREPSAAEKRRAQRHRANARFRSYGLGAIVLAVVFLTTILTDITIKAVPAFTQSTLKIDVPLTPEFIDPADPKAGDFDGAVRAALRNLFPNSTAKAERKVIGSLLSSDAGRSLRALALAEPKWIGQTVPAVVLLSSDADLYAKGIAASIVTGTGIGTAKPSGTSGPVTVEFAPGALANAPGAQREAYDSASPALLVAMNGGVVRINALKGDRAEGETLVPLTSAEPAPSGSWRPILIRTPESQRRITDLQIAFVELLKDKRVIGSELNTAFFARGDSREPELAGILGSLTGTAFTMLITLGLCLPIGLGAAIYLEEFAPRNRLTHLIEININNLAAVPSIVFGLLGLAVFLNVFGMPRSSPFVGGLVLALLVLPTIIIAARASLKSVPPSIREAAIGVGATHQQAVFHHVLPVAMPGILTGTIIGMAHALGETAPLLMIGMIAFITDVPKNPLEAATVLPVQIFLWSDLPEAGFQSKTAAAILVLIFFLIVMNGLAIWLRTKFERRW